MAAEKHIFDIPEGKTLVLLMDLDDTITRSTLHRSTSPSTNLKDLPPDFFIEGALEFIEKAKRSGAKVGITTHSYGDKSYVGLLEKKLAERGVVLDSSVCMRDVSTYMLKKCIYELYYDKDRGTFDQRHQELCVVYGKGSSRSGDIVIQSLKNIGGITAKDIPNTHIVTIGDSWNDVAFARRLKEHFQLKNLGGTAAIHLAAVELSPEEQKDVTDEIKENKSDNIPTYLSKDYTEVETALCAYVDSHMQAKEAVPSTPKHSPRDATCDTESKFQQMVISSKMKVHGVQA